jgi:hypothetical protein
LGLYGEDYQVKIPQILNPLSRQPQALTTLGGHATITDYKAHIVATEPGGKQHLSESAA